MSCRDAVLTLFALFNLLELRNCNLCIGENGLNLQVPAHSLDEVAQGGNIHAQGMANGRGCF
jgi:hypothetical protein